MSVLCQSYIKYGWPLLLSGNLLITAVDRNLDLVMLTIFDGAERTRSDFARLLAEADKRFAIRDVVRPEGSTMSVIDIEWKD